VSVRRGSMSICVFVCFIDLCCDCRNVEENNAFLNPSITTWSNELAGQVAARLFVNKKKFADIVSIAKMQCRRHTLTCYTKVFDIDGQQLPAHRVLLAARSPVLAMQLEGRFADGRAAPGRRCVVSRVGECAARTFADLLAFLYTMHAPIEDGDGVALMAVCCCYVYSMSPCVDVFCLCLGCESVRRDATGDVVRAVHLEACRHRNGRAHPARGHLDRVATPVLPASRSNAARAVLSALYRDQLWPDVAARRF
jgi:hypothetical protein